MNPKVTHLNVQVVSNGYTLSVHMEDYPSDIGGEVSPYYSPEQYVFTSNSEVIEAITKILDDVTLACDNGG